jgi:hypothetical protein
MTPSRFSEIQGYVRRTYSRLMTEMYGSHPFYTVEYDRGDHIEVHLARGYTKDYYGGHININRVPKPIHRSKASAEMEARIREHLTTAYNLTQLLPPEPRIGFDPINYHGRVTWINTPTIP